MVQAGNTGHDRGPMQRERVCEPARPRMLRTIGPDDTLPQREVAPFEALILDTPFSVCLIDADGTLRLLSRGAQRTFASIPAAIGRPLGDCLQAIWPERLADAAVADMRRTLETGIDQESTTDADAAAPGGWWMERVTLPDSRYAVICYFHDRIGPAQFVRTVAEREAQFRALTADLERRVHDRTVALHRANARLSAEIARLETLQAAQLQSQKLETVGQLTSGIAHDFNNILGAVLGGFAIIEHRTEDPRIQQIVAMGQRAAERGATLIRQLLAFTRLQDVVPQPVDLATAIAEISDLLSHGVRRNIALMIDCAPDAWPTLVDPTQLQAALLNLATNASDAMPGGGEVRIVVRNAQAHPATAGPPHPRELGGHDAVVILVTDTGPGMDGATLRRVTEPFFTTKARGKGTGLGLTMVQRFIQQSRGALRIDSEVGRGTTFSLYLPRATERDVAAHPPPDDPVEETLAETAFETLLLLNDDPDLSDILAAGLSDRGFEVLVARDAETALRIARARHIDVLVTDVDVPGMSGVDLVAAIHASGIRIPCVFITGGDEAQIPAGETVLRKPFSPAGLHYAVRRVLIAASQRASDEERIERLALRVKSQCARTLLDHWRAIRGGAGMPVFDRFTLEACHEPHRILIATIDLCKSPIEFTFTHVGSTLHDALAEYAGKTGGLDALPLDGADTLAAREAAYRRCALAGKPAYEYARVDLGEGDIETFERLLLPFSVDGTLVDTIVGAVVLQRHPVVQQR